MMEQGKHTRINIVLSSFNKFCSKYPQHRTYYTDCSKFEMQDVWCTAINTISRPILYALQQFSRFFLPNCLPSNYAQNPCPFIKQFRYAGISYSPCWFYKSSKTGHNIHQEKKLFESSHKTKDTHMPVSPGSLAIYSSIIGNVCDNSTQI